VYLIGAVTKAGGGRVGSNKPTVEEAEGTLIVPTFDILDDQDSIETVLVENASTPADESDGFITRIVDDVSIDRDIDEFNTVEDSEERKIINCKIEAKKIIQDRYIQTLMKLSREIIVSIELDDVDRLRDIVKYTITQTGMVKNCDQSVWNVFNMLPNFERGILVSKALDKTFEGLSQVAKVYSSPLFIMKMKQYQTKINSFIWRRYCRELGDNPYEVVSKTIIDLTRLEKDHDNEGNRHKNIRSVESDTISKYQLEYNEMVDRNRASTTIAFIDMLDSVSIVLKHKEIPEDVNT